ncbi:MULTISPECIES: hypothetical protein [Sphingosinicellaceae]|uniref:hypothetical protein n=1 Tax=Sphingosinicellaceae TaxID=2820280 RepID=UPI001C1E2CC1|nr:MULTISPECIES: hypothetical protein [Polymorphobacter]QYE33218.1 hypothetical protein KZX46_03675 [Polymorphobacter sp. PAMC 29334]UAJ12722.1 hypothetical protein KTC28_19440 [Polymorphobacter megasporae]
MTVTFQRRLIVDASSLKPADRSGWEAAVMYNLGEIARSNTGLCVLHELHCHARFVRVVPYPSTDKNAGALPTSFANAEYPAHPVRYGDGSKAVPAQVSTGLGSDVILQYTPWRFTSRQHHAATLLHELQHASEDVAGKLFANPLGWSFDTVAEFDAILVENMYRSEKGYPIRRSHRNLTDVLKTDRMVPDAGYVRLLRSFRDRMPRLVQQLGDVDVPFNPFRKGAAGYAGVQGDVPGSTRWA